MRPSAVLNNPTLRQKSTIDNDHVLPAKVLIDPTLTATMPPSLAALPVDERAERSVGLVGDLLRDIGIAPRLSDFGMTESDIDEITEIAVTSYYFDIECHPHPITRDDIVRIYRRCL